jgi:L-ascorbate metabolism protein UlaG (beta-lactamase superfamily)
MVITNFGHSAFQVEINGIKLLFDPFISGNDLANKIDISKINPNYILVSHGHNDHVGDTIEIAKRTKAIVISNYEICNWLEKKGLTKLHSMNLGGSYTFDFGEVTMTQALHSSSMPDGSYGGSAGGFLIQSNEGNFLFAGDTGLSRDFELVPVYSSIDFAFLPIGGNYTMGVDLAIEASEMIKCNTIIGMHYDTFMLIKINKEEAIEKFKGTGKELILPEIGQTIEL